MARQMTQDHMTSLRIPKEWDEWVKQFADKWAATPAYVYRSAIRDFIKRQGGNVRWTHHGLAIKNIGDRIRYRAWRTWASWTHDSSDLTVIKPFNLMTTNVQRHTEGQSWVKTNTHTDVPRVLFHLGANQARLQNSGVSPDWETIYESSPTNSGSPSCSEKAHLGPPHSKIGLIEDA